MTFLRQLTRIGRKPEFGPVTNGRPRTVDLAAETVELLKAHKRRQAELKMANRTAYQDHALVFAKEWGHLHGREDSLGPASPEQQLGQREFARLLKAGSVRPITVHRLRRTSATLLLKAGVAPHRSSSNGWGTRGSRSRSAYMLTFCPACNADAPDATWCLSSRLNGRANIWRTGDQLAVLRIVWYQLRPARRTVSTPNMPSSAPTSLGFPNESQARETDRRGILERLAAALRSFESEAAAAGL